MSNLGKVQHSPKGKRPAPKRKTKPPFEMPADPKNGEAYSEEEIAAMSEQQRQWFYRNKHLELPEEVSEDLIDYNRLDERFPGHEGRQSPARHGAQLPPAPPAPSVDHHSAYAGAPPAAALQHQRAPAEPLPPLELKYKEDPTRALKGWPDKDCPKFTGAPGKSAPDWLDTVAMLLGDCLAHPGIWHRVAGLCLSGKAFCDWKAALAAGTRPATWEQFRAWLLCLNPLGSLNNQLMNLLTCLCAARAYRALTNLSPPLPNAPLPHANDCFGLLNTVEGIHPMYSRLAPQPIGNAFHYPNTFKIYPFYNN
ncbi:hypothetical protein PTTG_27015 [Puccinia triticina 1-1 BBBD Race 1]|uniref:Uncharacterized protein n=1 Tax=Puccinia triticina (isolate 1-1 / race 1 (BBBD)) TaxID=630390 RepID=A0A180GN63_PUCT1|nr:hypothetical protein PTTG_27015 [Puccinia triticina 1-1 BBBD Race 1]